MLKAVIIILIVCLGALLGLLQFIALGDDFNDRNTGDSDGH